MEKFWAYLKTRSFVNNFFGALGTFVAIILIAYFSLGYYTRHGEGIPVPTLKGLPVEKAMEILTDQGFGYQIDSAYVLDETPGTIVEQDPDPGTNVKPNRIIYLTMVTRLAPPVTMPDLSDDNYMEAVSTLENYGLKVGDTIYKPDIADHILEAHFSGQVIKPGTKLPKGSVLDLVIGNGQGASEVDIPDLVNQDLDAAKFAIKGAGLTIGTINYEGAITDSTNLVVSAQYPAKTDSATKVSLGTRVNLTVIQGTKTNVPN